MDSLPALREAQSRLHGWRDSGPCFRFVLQAVKQRLLEQAEPQLRKLLDRAMWEAVQAYTLHDKPLPAAAPDALSR